MAGKSYGPRMSIVNGRAAQRRGGWGALAVAAGGLVRLGALVMVARAGTVGGGLALLVAGGVMSALGQALAVEGARRRLGAPTRLSWTTAAAGWAGALLGLATPALIGVQALRSPGAAALGSGLLLGWLAAFATALWAAGVCADDWRRERLPRWLRVAGAAFAGLSLAAAVLGPLALLALPLALAWWIGLGVALLHDPQSREGQRRGASGSTSS